MPWFKVDDGFHSHPKALTAGTPALGLWVRCGSWSAQQLTDGFVPATVVALYGTKAQAAALVSAGLWVKVSGGFSFHDWQDQQPTAQRVRADRHAATERQRRAREAAASRRDKSVSNGVSHGNVTPVVTVPPVPVPSTPVVVGRSSPGTGRAGDNRDLGDATTTTCRQLRPTWTDKGIRRAYTDALSRAGSEHRASIALLRVAVAPDSQAPRRVLTDGWWWDDTDDRASQADDALIAHLEEVDRVTAGSELAGQTSIDQALEEIA